MSVVLSVFLGVTMIVEGVSGYDAEVFFYFIFDFKASVVLFAQFVNCRFLIKISFASFLGRSSFGYALSLVDSLFVIKSQSSLRLKSVFVLLIWL